ncbi:MAG TPA: DUF2612 domain-containing protein [Polyangiaceae bacterium]|nr:DUF2612 domain-containing protein [Polyangiaceae bacterium]
MTLPQLAYIDDYADEASERPISQYRDKPRLLALILSYVRRCQELENAAWDVILKRMIDNAENAQLDTIGKIVGQSRGGQSDSVYRAYITARIRINRSQGHADDAIDVLMLVDAGIPAWTEYYPASARIDYTDGPATSPLILIDLAKLAIAAGVQLLLVAAPPGTEADSVFTYSNYGDPDVAGLGYGHYGSTSYGGVYASAYA